MIRVETRLGEALLLDCVILEATLYSCCTSEVVEYSAACERALRRL